MASDTTFSNGGLRGLWGKSQAQMARFNSRLGSSYLGRSLQLGVAESLGWNIQGPMFGVRGTQNIGWLAADPVRGAATKAAAGGAAKRGLSSIGGRIAGRGTMGLAMTGFFAYQGYKEEGWWGAAKGVGESVLWSAGTRAVGGMLGMWAAPLAIIGTAAAVTYAVGEAGREHHRKLREVEFTGSPQMLGSIYSAGAATMRQRSLLALQNTHINGRMAMGNEAAVLHQPFR